jgi:Fic-DOC domain mobile mystery protein B
VVKAVVLTGAHAPGATPLDPDDIAGLIPGHITTHGELNEWEEENILKAMAWLRTGRSKRDPLDDGFIFDLHRQMFGATWRWAGQARIKETVVGVDPIQIRVSLRDALADTREQLKHPAVNVDQVAARLHHRLVKIHPFPNGNGRHTRLVADLLLAENGQLEFSWGRTNLNTVGPVRDAYIAALRAADARDYGPLFAFVRS